MAALKAIPQNQFQNCFEGWTRAGIGAQLPKGSTLKATTVVFSNEVCSTFTAIFTVQPCMTGCNFKQNFHSTTHVLVILSINFC